MVRTRSRSRLAISAPRFREIAHLAFSLADEALSGRHVRGGQLSPDPPELDADQAELHPEPGGLTGTVLRGVGLAGLGYLLTQLLTMGFYLALARLATPEDFGQFAAASIVISAGLLFTESGMLAALIHRRDRIEEAASTAVVSTALAGVTFALLALAASPLIASFFDSDRIGTLAAAMSGLLFIRSLQIVPEALLQRNFSFLRRLVVQPCQVTAFGAAAIIGTSNGLGPWGLVVGYYASAVTDVLLSWTLVRWRPRLALVSFSTWRELIAYGRHVLASNVILRLGEQLPVALLGRFVGQNPLGQYRYADRMAATPFALVVAAASYVVFPAFARISHDRGRFSAAFLEALRWFAAIAMPLSMIFVPLGVPLALVLFGEVWREAGEAAMVLSVFAIGGSLVSVASETFKAEGRPDILVRVHAVTWVVGLAAMAALLPLELLGVAAGVSIGVAAGAAYALVRVGDTLEIKLSEMLRQLWPASVAAVAMAAIMLPIDRLLIDPPEHEMAVSILLLGAEGLSGLAMYGVGLVLLAPDTVSKLRELLALARRQRGEQAEEAR